MKNTLPFGFIIFSFIFLLGNLISALLQSDNERSAYGVAFILVVLIWVIILFLINYGLFSLFKTKIDWTSINNLKATLLDLFILVVINESLNFLNKQSIFSFQGLDLLQAAVIPLIFLSWRVIVWFLIRLESKYHS